jgi:hypothetical protein
MKIERALWRGLLAGVATLAANCAACALRARHVRSAYHNNSLPVPVL